MDHTAFTLQTHHTCLHLVSGVVTKAVYPETEAEAPGFETEAEAVAFETEAKAVAVDPETVNFLIMCAKSIYSHLWTSI